MTTIIKIKLQNNQQYQVIIHIRTLTRSPVTRSFALRQDRLSSVICLKICLFNYKRTHLVLIGSYLFEKGIYNYKSSYRKGSVFNLRTICSQYSRTSTNISFAISICNTFKTINTVTGQRLIRETKFRIRRTL